MGFEESPESRLETRPDEVTSLDSELSIEICDESSKLESVNERSSLVNTVDMEEWELSVSSSKSLEVPYSSEPLLPSEPELDASEEWSDDESPEELSEGGGGFSLLSPLPSSEGYSVTETSPPFEGT